MNAAAAGTVFIVDDAPQVRLSLSRLLETAGYRVRSFESAERFLEDHDCDGPACLVLDLAMPGMSGLDLQKSLVGSMRVRPIVFLTGQADIQTSVQAMKMGQSNF